MYLRYGEYGCENNNENCLVAIFLIIDHITHTPDPKEVMSSRNWLSLTCGIRHHSFTNFEPRKIAGRAATIFDVESGSRGSKPDDTTAAATARECVCTVCPRSQVPVPAYRNRAN
jgi:hypothetical protein